MRKTILYIILAVAILAIISTISFNSQREKPEPTNDGTVEVASDIEVVADNLSVPWEASFLPDDSILVTERTGTLKRISGDGIKNIDIEGTASVGEGGLLGMTLHPNFEENGFIYIYQTQESQNGLINRVTRYSFDLDNSILSDPTIILDNIPGARYHDGGRIKFGPDGYLYVTTGDAGVENNAQSLNSLAGKILRIKDDGNIPADNPFFRGDHELSGEAGLIYSYGHRNPQGLAWDEEGRLWSTEHGRSGVLSGFDELNLIEKGANYGWPVIQGDETQEGMVAPVAHSGARITWAPASLAYLNGELYWGGLRGSAVYKVSVSGNNVSNVEEYFKDQFGRIRDISIDTQNNIFITTSNTDGRGNPADTDDRVIKIPQDFLD